MFQGYIHYTILLQKEGLWAVYLTLGQDWGMGQYLRYQYRVYTRKSTQVSYPHYLHNLNTSSGYYQFQPYSSMVTNPNTEQGRPRYVTVCRWLQPCSHIMRVWLWLLAVNHRFFVLKHDIKLVRLSFMAVYRVTYWSYLDYSKLRPHKPAIWAVISRATTHGYIFK